ncbi:uncharacterized protein LOC115768494 [Drosophila novamexicana]|uniref:uncharacterized protein LOC115768494 n=1 Tax=Drosophila novamexicana TaxID=47314 RepID=UPI0011E5B6FC|nr:uncharacterized protein LOC115768494 [Drosophila novamexicana]
MLALITQSKLPRPWMQLGTGTATAASIHIPLKGFEESVAEAPPQEPKLASESVKRMGSRIPRMIRAQVEFEHHTADGQKKKDAEAKSQKDGTTAVAKGLGAGKVGSADVKAAGVAAAASGAGAGAGASGNGTKKIGLAGAGLGAGVERVRSAGLEVGGLPSAEMATATGIGAKTVGRFVTKGVSLGAIGTGAAGSGAGALGMGTLAGAAGAGAVAAAGEVNAGTAVPVVRSTRTSRCRIQLAHPDWLSTDATPTPSPSPSPVRRKRAETVDQERPRFNATKRKCLTEPLMQLPRSLSKLGDPLKYLAGRGQLLRFQCCDRNQINVPSQLINRFSPLMCERQKEPEFCFSQPIQLDTISSVTLLRLILWMQQHRHDNIKQLQKSLPSLANASSDNCTWDERFLGSDLDSVLQLLLAANCLGIYPLVEHAMLYFIELIEQRNNAERICMQHISQTLSELQGLEPQPHLVPLNTPTAPAVGTQQAPATTTPTTTTTKTKTKTNGNNVVAHFVATTVESDCPMN